MFPCTPPPPSKIRYLMFPVPHYYLYSSVSIKSWPYFPRSREINAMFPAPKTPAITFFLITILLIEKKHKRSRSNVLYDDSSGSSSKQEKDQRSSIFRDGKQCLSNSPEISGITFILLFYFIIMFLKVFLTGAYPDSILLTFTIITEVLA